MVETGLSNQQECINEQRYYEPSEFTLIQLCEALSFNVQKMSIIILM